jgi:uncharacterized protein YjdB
VKNASFAPNVVKRWFVLFATLALAASCGGMKKANLQTVMVSSSSQNLKVGSSVQLVAKLTYEGPRGPLPTPTPTWTSSAQNIATVNAAGVATGVSPGTATITAAAEGKNGVSKGTIILNVSLDRVLTQITLDPVQKLPVGATLSMVAHGVYNDGSMTDLTEQATWASSNEAAAKVSNGGPSQVKGVLVALKAGTTEISAAVGAVVGKTTVMVTNATVTKVSVTPLTATIAKGVTFDFKATAMLDDSSVLDVTSMGAAWDSSAPAVATIAGTGRATGVGMGVADITATFLTVKSAPAKLTVSGVPPKSLAVTPPAPTLPKGATVQLEADATFPDNTTQKVTNSAAWISADTAVATVDAAGKVTAVAPGTSKVTATFGTVSAFATVTVTPAEITSIAVTPPDATVPKGLSQTYTATATYNDGTSRPVTNEVTWATSDAAVASISNATGSQGTLTAVGPTAPAKTATAMVTATLQGKVGSTNVTVTDAVISALAVSPANFSAPIGLRVAYTARGLFTDGSNRDVTDEVTWSSSMPAVADISNATGSEGYATGTTAGTTTIKAVLNGVMQTASLTVRNVALASINIDPFTATIAKTTSIRLAATAIYADNTDYDITDQSDWSSSATAVATVSTTAGSRGQVTGVTAGSATITAAFGGMAKGAVVAVTNAVLVSLSVSPSNRTVPRGIFLDYHAAGVFDDNSSQDLTDQVVWSSTPTTSATVSNASPTRGRVTTSQTPGTAVIKATLGAVSAMTNLTVSAANLTALTVSPPSVQIAKLTSTQLTVNGRYVGTMPAETFDFDLTNQAFWQSSNTGVATVSIAAGSEGVVTGVAAGTATISATFGGMTGNGTVTVTNATIASITVAPSTALISFLTRQQFTATATFSDATTQPITAFATWTSSDNTKAVISNVGANKGEASGVDAGTVTIRANYLGAMGTAMLTVTSSPLASISVTPAGRTIGIGGTQQYVATGTFVDMTTQDITNLVTWSATNVGTVMGNVATISNNVADRGLATGGVPGATTIKAAVGAINGTTTLTVTPATLASIAVTPATRSPLPIGLTQQYTVTGTLTDGTPVPLTNLASWSLANGMLADGFVTLSTGGLATAVAVGTSTITATYMGKTSSATLTVTNAMLTAITIPVGNPSLAAGLIANYTAIGTYTDGVPRDVTAAGTWTSSAPTIVELSDTGTATVHATGKAVGTSTITVTYMGVTKTSTMTVTNATLSSVAVTPAGPTNMPAGTTLQLTVTGTYSDNNTADLTNNAATVWSIMSGTDATVSSAPGTKGLVTANPGMPAGGLVTVKATVTPAGGMAVSNTATVQVTAAVLTSIAITLDTGTNPAPRGTTPLIKATGTYSDATTSNLTNSVAWNSSNTTVAATPVPVGMAPVNVGVTALDVGMTTITAVQSGITGTLVLTVVPGVVDTITITAPDLASAAPMANQKIAQLTRSQLRAVAHYTDPMTTPDQDVTNTALWTVDPTDAAFASFAGTDGIVTALAPNAGTTIHAAFGGKTGNFDLDVTNATIGSIAVAPAAAGPYNGGTTRQFTAVGTFSDNSMQPLILQATWNSSNAAAATISNAAGSQGLATLLGGTTTRTTTISAIWNGVAGTLSVPVSGATLNTIEVTPAGQTLFVGTTTRFFATGIYSDNTTADLTNDTSVSWSTTGGVAAVSAAPAAGYVSAQVQGMGNVVAHYVQGMVNVTGQTAITVQPAAISALVVSAPTDPMTMMPVTGGPVGVGTQMTATATLNGVPVDVTNSVTWASSNVNIATVSATGLVTGVNPGGPVVIRATYNGSSSTMNANYTVSMAVLSSLEITPVATSTPKGIAVDFAAIGHYSDNSVVDHTTDGALSWGADNGVMIGLHTGHAVTTGTTVGAVSNIAASITVGGIMKSAATTLTISPVTLLSISVSRLPNADISVGSNMGLTSTTQFAAVANMSDNSHPVLTSTVTWTSSNGNFATVDNAGMPGLVTAKAAGMTTITAIDPVSGFTDSIVQTVIP